MITNLENIFIIDDDVESNQTIGRILNVFSKDIIIYSNWDSINELRLHTYSLLIFNSLFIGHGNVGYNVFVKTNRKRIGKDLFCMVLLDSIHSIPEEDFVEDLIYKPVRKFEILFAVNRLMKKINVIHENKILKSSILIKENTPLKEIEKQVIIHTVTRFEGSKAKAANILGISKRSIELKYNEWGL
ncbi:MAG: hypothetical protein H7A23_14795 [Leptospiraceae bacterium]|nr:hypothetical protein [Leptospiraceae bacterium]MCP5495818.1 hypothetical protein [Leptospiraceae bacterium]